MSPTPPYNIKWSYSMLNAFGTCPKRCWHQYIARDVPRQETAASKEGNDVHEKLELAVRNGDELPPELAHVSPLVKTLRRHGASAELQLGVRQDWTPCGFFDADVWGRGKLDVALLHPNGVSAALIDYKNGNPRNAKYLDNFELRVQAALLKAWFPRLRAIKGRYYWIKADSYSETYDLSDVDSHHFAIENILERIVDRKPENFTTRKGPLCKYCPVTHCKHWQPTPQGA